MSVAYIGIGSNIGNRQENCLHAIELLQKSGIIVTKRSSIYETEPWGVKEQPSFINMVIEVETERGPEELLNILKDIEKQMGRTETVKWGSRVIDLDILLFDNIILNTEDLKIPHPFMHERDFVLRPLFEISPDVTHPLLKMSVSALIQQLHKKVAKCP